MKSELIRVSWMVNIGSVKTRTKTVEPQLIVPETDTRNTQSGTKQDIIRWTRQDIIRWTRQDIIRWNWVDYFTLDFWLSQNASF